MSGVRPTLITDASWVGKSFLVTGDQLELVDRQNRYFSSADLKFTDTTPGGNFAINPPPQFTRTADIRSAGRFANNQNSSPGFGYSGAPGMGRYYSEAIDDNSQVINFRMGVADYNSLTTFFTGFYDSRAGTLARTGRSVDALYLIGKAAGFVTSILSFKLLAAHMLGVGLRFFLKKPSSKYYYLKPAMPLYWSAVQTMFNQIAVNRGVVPRIGGNDQQAINGGYQFGTAELQQLHDLLPDIFLPSGGIDVYALSNRAQRLAAKHYKLLENRLNDDTNDDIATRLHDVYKQVLSDDKKTSFSSYLQKWVGTGAATPAADSATGDGTSVEAIRTTDNIGGDGKPVLNPDKTTSKTKVEEAGFADFLEAELNDGGSFASFRVNYTGTSNESFSNTVGDSEIATKLNSITSQGRSTSFSLAGGNITEGVGAIVGAAKSLVSGYMDGLGISGLAALGGAAFVDIPKHWQSSVASLPRANYTINLVSPYGNPVSQLLNLTLPLCMLLAMALPLSTGKQSYTSPFLIEMYDQGRCQTRLGMIDSMSITRGVGNLGYSQDGQAMGIDVSFSIVDMSSVMHLPISQGFTLSGFASGLEVGSLGGAVGGAALGGSAGGVPGAIVGAGIGTVAGAGLGGAIGLGADALKNASASFNALFDDDTVFSDYMAVLSGMNLYDQIYQWPKFKNRLTQQIQNWRTWASPSQFASFIADSVPGQIASVLYRGTAR